MGLLQWLWVCSFLFIFSLFDVWVSILVDLLKPWLWVCFNGYGFAVFSLIKIERLLRPCFGWAPACLSHQFFFSSFFIKLMGKYRDMWIFFDEVLYEFDDAFLFFYF